MRGLWLGGAVVGAVTGGLAALPLAWVAGDRLAALDPDMAALGSVWQGTLAHIDGLPPVFTRLDGRSVLVNADAPGFRLEARAGADALSDTSLSMPVRALARFDARLSGLAGEVGAEIAALRFEGGACAEASGTARTDLLARNAGAWGGWRGPELSGPVTCENGEVVVSLAGRDASQTVEARVAISPTGSYRASVDIATREPGAQAVLPLFGFSPTASGWRLSESGSWR